MMRWLLYLLLYIPVQLFAYLITPLLPLFAVQRMGKSANANVSMIEPRLPHWLSWFDTPDNSLLGDFGWAAAHDGGYWSKVGWLYRNSLYGFKWSELSMPIQTARVTIGDPTIDYHTRSFGELYIVQANGAWQYKRVMPFCGKILVLNIGWLLDDTSQRRALFMLSPRLK